MHRDPAGVLTINAIANSLKDFWVCNSPTITLPILTKIHLDSQRVIQDHARKHPAQLPVSNNAYFDHHKTPAHISLTELPELDNWADDNIAAENDAFIARYAKSGHEAPPLSTPELLLNGHQDPVRQSDINVLGEYEEEPENNRTRPTASDGINCLPFGNCWSSPENVYNDCAAPESDDLLLLSRTSSKLPGGFATPCLGDRDVTSSQRVICDDVGTSMMPGGSPSKIGPPTDTVRDGISNNTTTIPCANSEMDVNTCEAVDQNCANPTDVVVSDYCGISITHNKTLSPQNECEPQGPLPLEFDAREGDHGTAISKASSPNSRKRKSGSDPAFRPPKPSKLQLTSRSATRSQSEEKNLDPIVSFITIPGKIIEPDFIHGIFAQRIDDKYHKHLPYLKRLFFHSWGPYALRQTADACATMRDTNTCYSPQVYPSIPNLSRALDWMEHEAPIRSRDSLVRLLEARQHRRSSFLQVGTVSRRGPRRSKAKPSQVSLKSGRQMDRADINSLADLMSEQYPTITPNDFNYSEKLKELQNRLTNAVNWQMAQKQYSSAVWMIPCGVKYLSASGFQRIPEPVITVYLDVLDKFRGDFICKVDERLACHLDDMIKGRRPQRKFRFEELDLKTLQSYSMDSDDLLAACTIC